MNRLTTLHLRRQLNQGTVIRVRLPRLSVATPCSPASRIVSPRGINKTDKQRTITDNTTMGAVHEIVDPQCRALDLPDALRGVSEATVHDGLFCRLCVKQCFGLYVGYKRRNAELEALQG